MRLDELRAIVVGLPGHDIGGYEWECDKCHYHWGGLTARSCGHNDSPAGYADADGRLTSHTDLIERGRVLEILDRLTP